MSTPTVRDNLSHCSRDVDYPFAQDTVMSFARHTAGAATISERSAYTRFSHTSAAAPTLHWDSETAEPGEQQGNLSERYLILNKLCVGAEAELFLGERLYDHERVVLKIYHTGIAPEPAVMERVTHASREHVVRLHEHGWNAVRYFEVQEYLPGKSLALLVGFHSILKFEAKMILQQVSAALRHLHTPDTEGRLLVHRDIKPANILIRDLRTLDLVLCDFGISSLIEEEGSTGSERRDCTPLYASPETFKGIITPKGDYWSLGIILLEALLGRHPLKDIPSKGIENLHREGWRPDLSLVAWPEWQELLAGLTHTDSDERWGYEEISKWLGPEAEPITKPAAEFDAAVEEEFIESFTYLQAKTLRNFIIKLIENWSRVTPLLDDSIFLRFLTRTLNSLAPDKTLEVHLDQNGHPDIRLLKFIYRLDPTFPLFWKGISILRHHLAEICRAAVSGDNTHHGLIEELYDLQVLSVIASLTGDDELDGRADSWSAAGEDYFRLTDVMIRSGASEELFLVRATALATLYIMIFEDGDGLSLVEADISNELLFEFPWLHCLRDDDATLSLAQQLLRSIFIPSCGERFKENFKVSHPEAVTAIHLESQQVRALGWRAPTIALNAAHIDYEMNICGKKMVVAKGVMIYWSVRGALLTYLTRFGFVASSGQRPNERMANWATYKTVDRCSCEDHNALWITLTETTSFTLTAIGPSGVAVYRLPPIVVPAPVLAPQIELSVPRPELLPQVELSAPIPDFVPQLQLEPVISFSVAAMGAKDLSVRGMTEADLLPRDELSVPPLGQADLQQQIYFCKMSDDQIRYAKENGLLRKRRIYK
ncbi:MAG: serine/threonine protein kinase [Desulfuromonadales bacterium]|nr:serine/threonine protein kinase [Desulfuromonadales bacterium]